VLFEEGEGVVVAGLSGNHQKPFEPPQKIFIFTAAGYVVR
jgi:hypothetical protein